ncbi:MAG: phosphatidylcholine/phosphatidylserine synthase [Pseudomonadota bacterium]|nr:phosphatidylcholine/phosphatidylserine synthase [Pseudomonadota bacterium]
MTDPHPQERRRRRLREQPVSRLFPNMVTLAGLCCGLSAIRFAMTEHWEMAVAFILAAALIDGMDGRIARMLGATSLFGAQLDSLSDFLCFGISPALVLYMWQLHEIQGIGWAVVLFFAVCTALRLARFNTGLFDDGKEPWEKQFFVGVPSPAGGILSLLPLIISLQFGQGAALVPAVTACHMLLVGTLMASRIPTYAGKHIRIPHEHIPQFMIACSLALVLFIIEPWLFLSGLSLVYLGSIYFSVRKWRLLKGASKKSQTAE